MRCNACGSENDRASQVCHACGAALFAPEGSQYCARCGDLQSGVICTRCGATLPRAGGVRRMVSAVTVATDVGRVEIERHRVEPVEAAPITVRMPPPRNAPPASPPAAFMAPPIHAQPIYPQPVYAQPVYAQPVYAQPYPQPVYAQPAPAAAPQPPVAYAPRPYADDWDDDEEDDERPRRVGVIGFLVRMIAAAILSSIAWSAIVALLIDPYPTDVADFVRGITPDVMDEDAMASLLGAAMQLVVGSIVTFLVFRLTVRRRAR